LTPLCQSGDIISTNAASFLEREFECFNQAPQERWKDIHRSVWILEAEAYNVYPMVQLSVQAWFTERDQTTGFAERAYGDE